MPCACILTFTNPLADGERIHRTSSAGARGRPRSANWPSSRIRGLPQLEPDPLLRPHGRRGRRRLCALRLRLCELRGADRRTAARFRRRPATGCGRRLARRRRHRRQRPVDAIAKRRSTMRVTSARRRFSGRATSRPAGSPARCRPGATPTVNAATGNFFADTLRTIQASYLRPTHAGFLAFFRDCAPRAAAAIAGELSAGELLSYLDRRYRESLGSGQQRPQEARLMAGVVEPLESEEQGRGRIPRAGGREGARHPGVHGRPGERADADRDLRRPRPLDPRDLPHPAPSGDAAAISCAPVPTATGCR